jgi:hypothetical protein
MLPPADVRRLFEPAGVLPLGFEPVDALPADERCRLPPVAPLPAVVVVAEPQRLRGRSSTLAAAVAAARPPALELRALERHMTLSGVPVPDLTKLQHAVRPFLRLCLCLRLVASTTVRKCSSLEN